MDSLSTPSGISAPNTRRRSRYLFGYSYPSRSYLGLINYLHPFAFGHNSPVVLVAFVQSVKGSSRFGSWLRWLLGSFWALRPELCTAFRGRFPRSARAYGYKLRVYSATCARSGARGLVCYFAAFALACSLARFVIK